MVYVCNTIFRPSDCLFFLCPFSFFFDTPTINLPDSRDMPRQKYITGLDLGWTCKIDSDFGHPSPTFYRGVKKWNLASIFHPSRVWRIETGQHFGDLHTSILNAGDWTLFWVGHFAHLYPILQGGGQIWPNFGLGGALVSKRSNMSKIWNTLEAR